MQVRLGGSLRDIPGKKPPVTSIASKIHIATMPSPFFQRPSSIRHAAVPTKESRQPPSNMREVSGGPMEELSTAISRKLGSYPTSHQVKGRANPPSYIFRVLVCQEHQGYLLPSIISRPLSNIHKNLTEESWPMIGKPSPVIMDEVHLHLLGKPEWH